MAPIAVLEAAHFAVERHATHPVLVYMAPAATHRPAVCRPMIVIVRRGQYGSENAEPEDNSQVVIMVPAAIIASSGIASAPIRFCAVSAIMGLLVRRRGTPAIAAPLGVATCAGWNGHGGGDQDDRHQGGKE